MKKARKIFSLSKTGFLFYVFLMMSYQTLVQTFNLLPHPEGGFYKEVYRSGETIPVSALPSRFKGERVFATGIYFLLLQNNFSAFHRIQSDESWHFYIGGSLLIHIIHHDGTYQLIHLGNDIANGEVFQAVVPAGSWFASECAPGVAFSFAGCTVSPGFDFADFELAFARDILAKYPEHKLVIKKLCRQ
jgi:predicted cupin superfamily sugar epimerase